MKGLDRTLEISNDWREDERLAQFDHQTLGRIQWILDYWKQQGAAIVALPWIVPEACIAHTRPEHAPMPDSATHEGPLVASGEQSFLWLEKTGLLDPNTDIHIGWSPCFRHEKKYDQQHHHYFLKVELFALVKKEAQDELQDLIKRVVLSLRQLAKNEGRPDLNIDIIKMPDNSYDLMLLGIELGSYGTRRSIDGLDYIYGTAIAEPRWSHAWRQAREIEDKSGSRAGTRAKL